MMTLLRKHRNWLMIVIAVLAIPFIFYFNKTDFSRQQSDQFTRLYNRNISMIEARRDARLFSLAQALDMQNFCQALTVGAKGEGDASGVFVLNLLILRHEAERLGIRPTSSEIADVVRNLRVFRGASGFDIKKYNEFTQEVLSPNGMTEVQMEELASDELCLNRIKQLVATGISVPSSESKDNFEQLYGKLSVSVIRLHSADFAKDIKVTDDDVRKYYEAHKAELRTEEKRKVELVSLSLTEEQKKLSGKERVDVLQKLADRSNDFTQALLEKGADFHQMAAKFQLPVQATGEFTAREPDPKLKTEPQLGASAFQLTTQEPSSEPIQAGSGFYILHLAGVVEARTLTLEEAKPKIVDAIKTNRVRELVSTKGAKAAHDLREGLIAGESLSLACEKVNVKAEKLEPFALMDEIEPADPAKQTKNKPPNFSAIQNAVAALQPGEVSEFFPVEDGGIIVVLEKRETPDETKYREKKVALDERILKNKREVVFYEWLHDRQKEAGIISSGS